ncbi:MAG: two-component sensor histidine kinase [Spirulina sp. SIO3F2]|nr:two-component sensor histidine kinase [Spirulina sp. SIO3F2]
MRQTHRLFRRSRLQLALWYSLVMGSILSLASLVVYHSIVQANWAAMEQEVESIAGTLHDSLEPQLPTTGNPTVVLQQILPDLCLVGQPCTITTTLIERHTTGISDRALYYIRLFDHHGQLLAFSPNQPVPLLQTLSSTDWQTIKTANGVRYRQFTTTLHRLDGHHLAGHSHDSWGYLQIGRTLTTLDAATVRLQWILGLGFPLTMLLVVLSSWWLSGLAIQPIYQSYQQQQQFTANAAHELRSPLASLLATVEAISRLSLSEQDMLSTMLNTVERQGRRLSHLINDLLLLSNLEQNKNSTLFQPCCLNDLVNDLTEEFLELAIAADIKLTGTISESLIQVLGDEPQLYRLLSNVLTNAIHYTPSGGTVQISLKQHNHLALITVQDSGIGISAQDLPRIFERFYRANSDRSRKTGGTGLGLAIAQAIAHHHQGHITVKSTSEQGSVFTLHLPC